MGYYDGENFRHVVDEAVNGDSPAHAGLERQVHNGHLHLNRTGWQIAQPQWGERRHASIRWSDVLRTELMIPAQTDEMRVWLSGRVDDRTASGAAEVYTEAALMGIASRSRTLTETGANPYAWEYVINVPPAPYDRWALFALKLLSKPTTVIQYNVWGQVMPNGSFYLDLTTPAEDSHGFRMDQGGDYDFLCALEYGGKDYGTSWAMTPGREGQSANSSGTIDDTDYNLFTGDHVDLSYLQIDSLSYEFAPRDDALARVDPRAAAGNQAYDAGESAFKHAINTNILVGRARPAAVGRSHTLPDAGTDWPIGYPRKFGVEGGGFTWPDDSLRFSMLPRQDGLKYLLRLGVCAVHLQPGYTRGFAGSGAIAEDRGRVELRPRVEVRQHTPGSAGTNDVATFVYDQWLDLWPGDQSGNFPLLAAAQYARYDDTSAGTKRGASELTWLFKDGQMYEQDYQFITPVQFEFDFSGVDTEDVDPNLPLHVSVMWDVTSSPFYDSVDWRLPEGRSEDEIIIITPGPISCWEVLS